MASVHYLYHQVWSSKNYVGHLQCVCVFCVNLRSNSDYFSQLRRAVLPARSKLNLYL